MLRKVKKIKKLIILLPILLVVITGSYFVCKIKFNQNVYKDNTRVLNTISQVLDLNTVKYNYSNVITIKKDKSINDVKLPFTEKSFIIKYNGIINGGVRPEDIRVVKNTGREIYIEVKQCRILDHYIDSENVYVYDIKNSLFNKLEVQEVLEDINTYKEEYEKKAIEEGLLKEIQISTKESLENLMENLGYKEVVVEFK